jgi:hypothetical protein
MNLNNAHLAFRSSSRLARLKDAVVASFSLPADQVAARFEGFGLRDWERILYWLDISGLALYLLDRLAQLHLQDVIPESICLRLKHDLIENRRRNADLLREALEISRALDERGVLHALLKGATLTPESVPDLSLRSQTDLDFLIAANQSDAVKRILDEFDYALHAVSGNTLEFKSGSAGKPNIRNMYRTHSLRSVEVHLIPTSRSVKAAGVNRLARASRRNCSGIMIPALSAADAFIQQGEHLFKHLCGEHTRTSWVLEFWRHIQYRRNDVGFWNEVALIVEREPAAAIALAASAHLATTLFGGLTPELCDLWREERLPKAAWLWIDLYGRRVLYSDSPGNKLYLLLRRELGRSRESRAEAWRLVFPIHFPPPITHGKPEERSGAKLRRYRIEMGHILARACFHLVEGLKYAVESARWQRRIAETPR